MLHSIYNKNSFNDMYQSARHKKLRVSHTELFTQHITYYESFQLLTSS